MSAADTLRNRVEFIDRLRIYLLDHETVTAQQIAQAFGITDRQARNYMYALETEQIGSQRERAYRWKPDETVIQLAKKITE